MPDKYGSRSGSEITEIASGTARAWIATRAGAVVVVPVFNERESVHTVLDDIVRWGAGTILIVDDGSTDGSAGILDDWAAGKPGVRVLHLPENHGKSAALRAAWGQLRDDLDRDAVSTETAVITIDADGQHDLTALGALVARLDDLGADAVIARRDMRYHGRYKRAGNWVMTALGSLCGGTRLHDIESGYRVVRLGPLLHAHEFYKGRRYSEAAEQVVVLGRLGYRVDNEYMVQVPVERSRTRLRDAVNHAVSMCAAWYRVLCWRETPREQRSSLGAWSAALLLGSFVGLLAVMLTHRVYLGNDSAQSYAHVWHIARSLFGGEGLPLHMASLESGRAFTFPYAAIPWLPTALVYPVLGDWAVTASMVLGVVLLAVGIWRWLPRTANPLMTALFLLNPQLWMGVAQFQLPTVWAFAFVCFSAAAFDREQPRRGTALAVAALVAHPLMGATGLLLTVLLHIGERRRAPVLRVALLGLAAVITAPAVWIFASMPLVEQVGYSALLVPLQATLTRLSMLWWPWLVQRFGAWSLRVHAPLLLIGLVFVAHNASIRHPHNLWDYTQPRFADYIEAGQVDTGTRYRVLTMTEHEDVMVQLIRAGGTLAHEFFDESIKRDSFRTTENYRCFLGLKRTTHVLVSAEWQRRGYTDELRLLDQMVEDSYATLAFRGLAGTLDYKLQGNAPLSCPGVAFPAGAPRTAQ